MKFDVFLPGSNHIPGLFDWAHDLDADGFRRILQTVDALGYNAVEVSEHIALPRHEVPRLGPFWPDPFCMMTFAVAVTARLRVDTAVLVLPYHHPLRLAKALATIDHLSGGRLNISIGVGHAEQEFASIGVPFERRGAITDEMLAAMNTLWTDPQAEHHGEFFQISGLAFEPRPVQVPRPPIYVGGNSKPALRRAARHEGWQPNTLHFDLEEIPPLYDYIREQPEFAGKEATFDINWLKAPKSARLPGAFRDASAAERDAYRDSLVSAYAGPFAEVGITRSVIPLPRGAADIEEYLDYITWFAEEVMSSVPPGHPDNRGERTPHGQ